MYVCAVLIFTTNLIGKIPFEKLLLRFIQLFITVENKCVYKAYPCNLVFLTLVFMFTFYLLLNVMVRFFEWHAT